jgi:IclR family transcriptional regulator, acetate operon repressor
MSDSEKVVGSDRVLAVLLELAEHPGGITLDDLAQRVAGSKPTVHRALASLRKAGLASQSARGVYELGDEFLRLAYRFQDARPETARIEPLLRELAGEFGETAHYGILDGTRVVYRAKVDPPIGAIRLTSTIGGRNPAYCTAIGKLLLGYRIHSVSDLEAWRGDTVLSARTERTITTPDLLFAEIEASRARGYGIDDQENEVGINCIALPVFLEPGRPVSGAVSISGLAYRRSLASLVSSVEVVRGIIESHLGVGSTRG